MKQGDRLDSNNKKRCPSCFSELTEGSACRCGFPKNGAAFLRTGAVLNRTYAVGAMYSFNGFTAGYICFDQKRGERVLIKEYCPLLLAERSKNGSLNLLNEEDVDEYNAGMQFFRNRTLVRSVQTKDAVFVPLRDSFFGNNTAYAVVDYHDNRTLDSYLREGGRSPEENAKTFTANVLKALYVLHRAGAVHGNLSPKTVFISTGRLIVDGLAPQSEELSLLTGAALPVARQYEYLPLSALLSPPEGPETDLFAAGALAYSLLTGKKPASPFSGNRRLDSGALANACADGAFYGVILNLCGEGNKTYTDASQALADFGIAVNSPAETDVRTIQEYSRLPSRTMEILPTAKKKKKKLPVIAAVIAVLLIATLFLWPRLFGSDKETGTATETDASASDSPTTTQAPTTAADTTKNTTTDAAKPDADPTTDRESAPDRTTETEEPSETRPGRTATPGDGSPQRSEGNPPGQGPGPDPQNGDPEPENDS